MAERLEWLVASAKAPSPMGSAVRWGCVQPPRFVAVAAQKSGGLVGSLKMRKEIQGRRNASRSEAHFPLRIGTG